METHFTKAELLKIIDSPGISIRNRALISFLFITGARVGEIVKIVRKNQVEFVEVSGKKFMIVNDVPIEKRRQKIKRNIPINIEREQRFVDAFMRYIGLLEDNDVIFNINRVRAFQIIQKYTGKGCHFLRHSRLTNLRTEYGFDGIDQMNFTGWASPEQAVTYSHLNYMDIAKKMTR
jgi:integrase